MSGNVEILEDVDELEVEIGEDQDGEEGAIDIPDLTDADSPLQKILFDEGEILEESVEEDTKIETPKKKEEVLQKTKDSKSKDKSYKNPHARIRILEAEKSQLEDSYKGKVNDLEIKVSRLYNELLNVYNEQQNKLQDQEEEIDAELDPGGAALQKNKKLELELKQVREMVAAQERAKAVQAAIANADAQVHNYIAEDQEDRVGAIKFLAEVVRKTAENRLPHLTSDERLQAVNNLFNEQKIEWMTRGLNPGEQLYNLALTYGYTPAETDDSDEEEVIPKPNLVREKITAQKKKNQAGATLGGITSHPPSGVSADQLKNMEHDVFNATIDNLIKSGKMRAGSSYGKTPRLSELLAGRVLKT